MVLAEDSDYEDRRYRERKRDHEKRVILYEKRTNKCENNNGLDLHHLLPQEHRSPIRKYGVHS